MASKFALVIANTEYQDASFAKLTAPGKDAEEFAQVLRDSEFCAFDDVQIVLNEGEGKTRRSIARFFAERKPDDLLLLYFSGHGVRNDQGQLYLAAHDTEISILEATGIPAEFVTQAMNNSRSKRQLLILDCCNSGAFAHGSKSASGVGKSMGIATAFEGDGYGRVVLTATDATQFAWEGDKVIGDTQKSVFTHFLIEGLKGEADRDGDGRIKVDELYDYAYEQVVRRTPKQTPGKWSYRQQGDIILRENLRPSDVRPAPLSPDLLELLSHPNPSVRKVGVQDLIGLLEGKHLGLARSAEEKLREIAANDDSLTLRKTASDTLVSRGGPSEQPIEAPNEGVPSVTRASIEIPRNETSQEKKIENKNVLSPPIEKDKVIEKIHPPLPDLGSGKSKQNRHLISVTILVILGVALALWIGSMLLNRFLNSTPQSTHTSQPSTKTGQDGMTLLYIRAGEFTMGSENGAPNERPAHKVNLRSFWIDKTEVTNKMYALCVDAGGCVAPRDTDHFTNSGYANHPVIYVSSIDAGSYCIWAGRRLPAEAEWEKAATGTEEQIYPWGNEAPDSSLLNYDDEIGETTEVGNYPEGASPYGALDMAGNVWEWVHDWYDEIYYSRSPLYNPPGPVSISGKYRVIRGGGMGNNADFVRSLTRAAEPPDRATLDIGFRCAMDVTP